MYTKEDICQCLGLPNTITNKELKKKCKQLRIHCRALAYAIDNKCKPEYNSVYNRKKWKSMSRKQAQKKGLDWVLLSYEQTKRSHTTNN